MNLHDTLADRGKTYGNFLEQSRLAKRIKNAIHAGRNNLALDADQEEALDMIAVKIARIMNGDPNHRDSWHDIAGYATLIADRLEGK